MKSSDWYVYMVRCVDNRIYVGVTTEPARRWWEHNNSPKGAKYTRRRRPVEPIWVAKVILGNRSRAQKVEYWLKRRIRVGQKRKIAAGDYSEEQLDDLGCPIIVVFKDTHDFTY